MVLAELRTKSQKTMSGEHQIYGRKGKFSLIGLLVVLGILSGTWQPKIAIRLPMGRERSARIEMKELEESLQLFYLDVGRYPTTSEGLEATVHSPWNVNSWQGPYRSTDLPKDPWGKRYIYRCPGGHNTFDLSSSGPDGVEDSIDDIVSWK